MRPMITGVPRFKRPASPDPERKRQLKYLNPDQSAIAQVWGMTGAEFNVIKDAVASRKLTPEVSLRLLPETGWLAPFECVTYAPWWLHLVTWIPACLAVWLWALPHTFGTVGLILVGCLGLWPVLEYMLHRFFFHMPVDWTASLPQWAQGSVNVIRLLSHTVHHAHPTDRRRIITPLPMSMAIALLVFPLLFALVRDVDAARALAVGLVLGYVGYDYVHYDLHLGLPVEQWPAWMPRRAKLYMQHLRRAHRNHHYAPNGHQASFGVSWGLWDRIFRTQAKAMPLTE